MMRAAALLLAVAACNPPPVAPPAPAQPGPTLASRVPRREDLVCFPCHSQLKFDQGPPFAHALAAHRQAGHCHVCHQGSGHEPREIDQAACLACHRKGARALAILAQEGGR